jgi:hypothetical protein
MIEKIRVIPQVLEHGRLHSVPKSCPTHPTYDACERWLRFLLLGVDEKKKMLMMMTMSSSHREIGGLVQQTAARCVVCQSAVVMIATWKHFLQATEKEKLNQHNAINKHKVELQLSKTTQQRHSIQT